jgi:hypothetical protein
MGMIMVVFSAAVQANSRREFLGNATGLDLIFKWLSNWVVLEMASAIDMKNRYLLNCGVLVLATLALTLALYSQLPARIPTHWNGRRDRRLRAARVGVRYRFHGAVHAYLDSAPVGLAEALHGRHRQHKYWQICVIFVALFGYIQCTLVFGAYSPTMPMHRTLFGGLAIFVGLSGM